MAEPKRVLLLDSDKSSREAVAKTLRENGFGPDDGFIVVELGDLEIGWRAIQRDEDFVAVICPWTQAEEDSLEFVKRLRAHENPSIRNLAVIIHARELFNCQMQVGITIPHVVVVGMHETHRMPGYLYNLLIATKR